MLHELCEFRIAHVGLADGRLRARFTWQKPTVPIGLMVETSTLWGLVSGTPPVLPCEWTIVPCYLCLYLSLHCSDSLRHLIELWVLAPS